MTTKRLIELHEIKGQIQYALNNNIKDAFEIFVNIWSTLNNEDKELLKPQIIGYFSFLEEGLDGWVIPIRGLVCKAIEQHMDADLLDKKIPHKLSIGNGFTQKQLAKLFYDIKSKKAITNTNEEIAKVISDIFDFKYSTILHYLKNPSEFVGVPDILNSKHNDPSI